MRSYALERKTLTQLAATHQRSIRWIRDTIYAAPAIVPTITPQSTVIIADTTFWGRSFGVTVFRSPSLKKNLWWEAVESERVVTYRKGRRILEAQGWTITAAVVDGRRGLAQVFHDVPVQICIFHQMKRVTRYLTRRPQTPAGQALRSVMLQIPHTTEQAFTTLLAKWYDQWKDFISERTTLIGTDRWFYTHKSVRGAYYSMKRNLPYLFTREHEPDLHIPTTTNSLDGMFTQLKNKVGVHRGLTRERRLRIISEILVQ